jgi:hypothetical protein
MTSKKKTLLPSPPHSCPPPSQADDPTCLGDSFSSGALVAGGIYTISLFIVSSSSPLVTFSLFPKEPTLPLENVRDSYICSRTRRPPPSVYIIVCRAQRTTVTRLPTQKPPSPGPSHSRALSSHLHLGSPPSSGLSLCISTPGPKFPRSCQPRSILSCGSLVGWALDHTVGFRLFPTPTLVRRSDSFLFSARNASADLQKLPQSVSERAERSHFWTRAFVLPTLLLCKFLPIYISG